MKLNELTSLKKKKEPYVVRYIIIIIIITITSFVLRIIFYFLQEESTGSFFIDLLIKNRDLNFKTNYELMHNGILHYYEQNPLINEVAVYLYFWYFIFYPFYIIPLEISLYTWDILRFISTIYIAININKIIGNRRDLLYFFVFSGIGYFSDMYLNNTNWIIQFFLYESYVQLEKNKMVFSGIFFTLAMFKIILIAVPFILVIIKKIKLKNLVYYFLPLILICIPYIIFPEYLLSMISNWLYSAEATSGLPILSFFLILWRLIQPAHLMFVSLIVVIIIINIKDQKARKRFGSLIYTSVFVLWVLVWLIILEIALFF